MDAGPITANPREDGDAPGVHRVEIRRQGCSGDDVRLVRGHFALCQLHRGDGMLRSAVRVCEVWVRVYVRVCFVCVLGVCASSIRIRILLLILVRTRIPIPIRIAILIPIRIHMHLHTCLCVHARTARTKTHNHVHMRIHPHIQTCAQTHTHAHARTHALTYTCAHARA